MPAAVKRPAVEAERIKDLIDHAAQKFAATMALKGEPNRLFFPHGITSLSVEVTVRDLAGVKIAVSGPESAKPGIVNPAAGV